METEAGNLDKLVLVQLEHLEVFHLDEDQLWKGGETVAIEFELLKVLQLVEAVALKNLDAVRGKVETEVILL